MKQREAVEINAVRIAEGKIIDEYHSFVKPVSTPKSFQHINPEDLGSALPIRDVFPGFLTYLKDDIVAIGDALLGVRVTKGTHTVTFKYMPEGLLLGAILSVLALATVLLLLFIKKKGWFSFNPELYVETVTEEIDAIDAFDANSNIAEAEENVSSEEQNNETLEE